MSDTFEMQVRDVFTVTGRGTVFTGVVRAGTVRVGDRVSIAGPSGQVEAKVLGLEKFREVVTAASAGEEIGVVLNLQSLAPIADGLRAGGEPETKTCALVLRGSRVQAEEGWSRDTAQAPSRVLHEDGRAAATDDYRVPWRRRPTVEQFRRRRVLLFVGFFLSVVAVNLALAHAANAVTSVSFPLRAVLFVVLLLATGAGLSAALDRLLRWNLPLCPKCGAVLHYAYGAWEARLFCRSCPFAVTWVGSGPD